MTPTFAPHGIAFPCASWPQDAQFFFANRRFGRPNRIDLTGFRPAMGVFHMNRPDPEILSAPAAAAPARLPYTDRRKNCGHMSHHQQPAITAGGRLSADRRGTSFDHAARHQGNGDGSGKQPRRRARWCRGCGCRGCGLRPGSGSAHFPGAGAGPRRGPRRSFRPRQAAGMIWRIHHG